MRGSHRPGAGSSPPDAFGVAQVARAPALAAAGAAVRAALERAMADIEAALESLDAGCAWGVTARVDTVLDAAARLERDVRPRGPSRAPRRPSLREPLRVREP
jgi:hypothetical protein